VLFIFDFVFNLAAGLTAGVLALAAILLFIVLIPRSPRKTQANGSPRASASRRSH
jgi:hypothetical protein